MKYIALLLSVLFTGCASSKQFAPFRPTSIAIELGDKPTITFNMERAHERHSCRFDEE